MKKIISTLVVLSVFISSLAFAKNYPFERVKIRTFEIKGDDSIEVQVPYGDIEIIKTNKNKGKIEAKVLFTNKQDAEKYQTFGTREGQSIKNNKTNMVYKIINPAEGSNLRGQWTCKMKVYVPNGKKIKASSDAGNIKISNIEGVFDISLDSGNLTATRIKFLKNGKNEIDVENGNIDIKSFEIENGSKVDIEGDNTNVKMKSFSNSLWSYAKVKAKVDNGMIYIKGNAKKDFQSKTFSNSMSAKTDGNKSNGSIKVDVDNGLITFE